MTWIRFVPVLVTWLMTMPMSVRCPDTGGKDGGHVDNYRSLEAARDWMEKTNQQLQRWNHLTASAEWNFATNISDETQQKEVSTAKAKSEWLLQRQAEGREFHVQNLDPDLRRQFDKFTMSADPRDPAKASKITELEATMLTTYDTATVCLTTGHHTPQSSDSQSTDDDDMPPSNNHEGRCLPLEPDLETRMSESRDPAELKAVWEGWREAAGKSQRQRYQQFVELLNEGARDNGFNDYGDYWAKAQFPDHTDLESMVSTLWGELRPLYLELHAYTRRRLRQKYGAQIVGTDGTIPAHLLGNMWAQSWGNIFPLVTPFPGQVSDSLNDQLKRRYNVSGLFRLSEEFYVSLGLFNMTQTFWARSMLEKPENRDVQCHASAFDLFSHDDFRIKMCSSVTASYLSTIHHEMGHVQYFMAYAEQPTVYRDSPNQGFHEAVGDTTTLAVMSRTHLRKLGLVTSQNDDNRTQINDLMQMALQKIAFLPFALVVDQWRWQVFRGDTTPDTYNHDWWKLRLDLQGLRSPGPRSEEHFDAVAKMHVPGNSPYYCYFISHVVQFQFYKSLCEKSGHQGPLHLCDFGGSLHAGTAFKKFLALGASRPWQEALETFTGSRKISTQPLLEYFEPLRQWLKRENEQNDEHPGWDGATINWHQQL